MVFESQIFLNYIKMTHTFIFIIAPIPDLLTYPLIITLGISSAVH